MSESEQHPRVRVAAIIEQDGSVLMVRHEKGADTYWLLPGGGVDFGESLVTALERELRELMKRAGCIQVTVGLESGSQRILDTINKNSTVEENMDAAHMAHEAGLRVRRART